MKPTQSQIGLRWCKVMHTTPMWPVHGWYECWTCGRRHRVCWEQALTVTTRMMLPAETRPSGAPVNAGETRT